MTEAKRTRWGSILSGVPKSEPHTGTVVDHPSSTLDQMERREAADEIERLRNEVSQLRHTVAMAKLPTDTPLASRVFPNPFKL